MTALTPIALYCQLRDITRAPGTGGDDNVVASDTALAAFDLPTEADTVSTAMIEVANNSPLAAALTVCAGGTAPSTSTKKYICEISFSGTSAGPFDYRFVVETIQRGLTVVASGRNIYAGYVDNAVARLTLNRTFLADALNGGAGSIISQPDSPPIAMAAIFDGVTLPQQKGLFQTEPNPPDGVNDPLGHSYFTMFPFVSPQIGSLLVDADSNDNFIDLGAKEFIALSVGLPIDGTPLGSYGHIVADSSDGALNLTGHDQGLAIGFLGTEKVSGVPNYVVQADHLTFARDMSAVDTTKALIIEPDEGLVLTTDLGGRVTKINPSGGFSNHGLPVGAAITDGLTIPNNAGHGEYVHWYDSLFLFTASDASGLGGLYFWPHNEIAYRIGQGLDFASCVAYDAATNKIYVGCRSGVFSITCAPGSFAARLDKEGALNMAGSTPGAGGVVAVRVGASSTITAQVQGSGPADGIYLRDAGAPTGYGYDGWRAFDTAGPIIGYHYDAGGDTLYCVYSDNPAVVVRTNNATTTSPSITNLPTPTGAHIVGIDALGGYGAGVRTEDGALGLCLAAATIDLLDPTGTLIDRYGAPVQINRVQLASDLYIAQTTGSPARVAAALVASTDAGPYVAGSVADVLVSSGTWLAMPKQSGIGGESVQGTAIGLPQTLGGDSINPGRLTTRMYCWTSSGLWVSHSAGIWFDEELQLKVSLGPFISALGAISSGAQGQFLDNDVTVVGLNGAAGTPDAPASAGTSGRAVYVNPPAITDNGLQDLDPAALWLRPLDERNRWKYLFLDTASGSPTGRITLADFSSIQSDNATPVATAAGKLAAATLAKYRDAAIVPHDVQFDSVLAFQEMALRTLRPSHRVGTDYDTTPDGYSVDLSSTKFYVRRVRFYKGRADSVTQVQTDTSTVFRSAVASDQAIGDGLADTVSKMIRQGRSR